MPVGRSPPGRPQPASAGKPTNRPTSDGQAREWSLPPRAGTGPKGPQPSQTPPIQVTVPQPGTQRDTLNQETQPVTVTSPQRGMGVPDIQAAIHQSETGTEAAQVTMGGTALSHPSGVGGKTKPQGVKNKPPPVDKEMEEAKKSLSSARAEFTRYKNAHFLDRKKLAQLPGPELGRLWGRLHDLLEMLRSRSIQLRALTDDPEVLFNLDSKTASYQQEYDEILTFLARDTNRRKYLKIQTAGEEEEDDLEDGEQEGEDELQGGEDSGENQEDEDELDEDELRMREIRRLNAARKLDASKRQRQARYDQKRDIEEGAEDILTDEIVTQDDPTSRNQRRSIGGSQEGSQGQRSIRGSTSSVQSARRGATAADLRLPEGEEEFEDDQDPSVIATRTRGALRGRDPHNVQPPKPTKKQKKKPPKKRDPPPINREFQMDPDDIVLLTEASKELNWSADRLKAEIFKYYATRTLPQEIVNCQEEMMARASAQPVPTYNVVGASAPRSSLVPRLPDNIPRGDEINPAVLATIQQRQESFHPPPGRTSTTRHPEFQPIRDERTARVSMPGSRNDEVTRIYQRGMSQPPQAVQDQGGVSQFPRVRTTRETDQDEVFHNQRGGTDQQANYQSDGLRDHRRFQSRGNSPPREARREFSRGRSPSFGRSPGREHTRDPPRREDQRYSRPEERGASYRADHQSSDATGRRRGEGSRVFGDHSYIEDRLDLSSPYHHEDHWDFDPDRPMGKTWVRPDRVRFDGTSRTESFEDFKSTFSVLVGNKNVPESDKLILLKQMLDGDPKKLFKNVVGIDYAPGSLKQVFKVLEDCYGGHERLINEYINKLIRYPQMRCRMNIHSALDLLTLVNEIYNRYRRVDPVYLEKDPMIIGHLRRILCDEDKEDYCRQLAEHGRSDTFLTFRDYIQLRYDTLKRLDMSRPLSHVRGLALATQAMAPRTTEPIVTEYDEDPYEGCDYPAVHGQAYAGRELENQVSRAITFDPPRKAPATEERKKVISKCSYCEKEHYIWSCQDFALLPTRQRFEHVRGKRLCFHCLLGGHRIKDCKYRPDQKCGIANCESKHHRLVHNFKEENLCTVEVYCTVYDYEAGDDQEIVQSQVCATLSDPGEQRALLNAEHFSIRTVTLEISNGDKKKRVVAALDSCANSTNIDADLARELGLPVLCSGIKRKLGMLRKGMVIESDLVEFNLSPLDSEQKFKLKGFTVDELMRGTPVIDWNQTAKAFAFLQKAKIPTPEAGDRIQILIGTDNVELMGPEEVLKGEAGSRGAMAELTPLGWAFSGRTNVRLGGEAVHFSEHSLIHQVLMTLSQDRPEDEVQEGNVLTRTPSIESLGSDMAADATASREYSSSDCPSESDEESHEEIREAEPEDEPDFFEPTFHAQQTEVCAFEEQSLDRSLPLKKRRFYFAEATKLPEVDEIFGAPHEDFLDSRMSLEGSGPVPGHDEPSETESENQNEQQALFGVADSEPVEWDRRGANEALDALLQKYWEMEAVGLAERAPRLFNTKDPDPKKWTKAEVELDDKISVVYLEEDQQFQVSIPWKGSGPNFTSNRAAVLRHQERLLNKPGSRPAEVKKIFDSYLEKGYIRKLKPEERYEEDCRYLPFFCVVDESKETTPVRIVWNCRAQYNGKSLNSEIELTPNRLQSLFKVLLRLRKFRYTVTSDVSEMFLKIRMEPKDRKYHRFIFNGEDYEWQSILFGNISSPNASQKVLTTACEMFGSQFPEGAETLRESCYMDDASDSRATEEEAWKLTTELIELLKKCNMPVHKFYTNSPLVIQNINPALLAKQIMLGEESVEIQTGKILGMRYSADESDMLSFNGRFKSVHEWTSHNETLKVEPGQWTKKLVSSAAASIYDPHGLIAPFTVRARIILQEIWKDKSLDWDTTLPPELCKAWEKWLEQVFEVPKIQIPRWSEFEPNAKIQLHTFCDASEEGMCCAVYLRVKKGSEVKVTLLAAKARVSPLKAESISRLELAACVMGTRLCSAVQEVYPATPENVFFWTDSTVCLQWINTPAKSFKPFVAHRIGEIQTFTEPRQWLHVPGEQNPADIGTRHITAGELKSRATWWGGPEFLKQKPSEWPKKEILIKQESIELKSSVFLSIDSAPGIEFDKGKSGGTILLDPARYSSGKLWNGLERCVRLWSFVLRAARIMMGGKRPESKELHPGELEEGRNRLIGFSQRQFFREEFDILLKADPEGPKWNLAHFLEAKGSRILKFTAFLDEFGVLRSHSRLAKADIYGFEKTYPVILDRRSELARLLVEAEHFRTEHPVGHNAMKAAIGSKYIILGLGTLCEQIKSRCSVCRMRNGKVFGQLQAPLPTGRLGEKLRAFAHVGMDFAGPFEVKVGRGKPRRKLWVLLLTCLSTRAVHLEASRGMDTTHVVNALSRFSDVRGVPETITCDNQTSFQKSDKDLQDWFSAANLEVLKQQTNKVVQHQKPIEWIFNPPLAPHYGGVFEILVKATKRALHEVVGRADLDEEEFRTTLSKVMWMLNNRPIQRVGDSSDFEALTPNHFLGGAPTEAVFPPNLPPGRHNLQERLRYQIQVQEHFWKRFQGEIVPLLSPRSKWFQAQDQIKVDDVVIEIDENTPRGEWKKMRVAKVFPSQDGWIRRVEVQSGQGKLYLRPISRLIPIVL